MKKINRSKQNKFIRMLLLALIFLFFSIDSFPAQKESSLFWPPPPAPIRIVFVKSIYSAKDLSIKPTFLKKLREIIVGKEKEALTRPIAISLDDKGTIYICDPGASLVHIFNRKEKKYKKISTINGQKLISPVGIAINKSGLVFISDSKLRKVFCLDKENKLKFVIGEDKMFLRPTGLAANEEKLYVVDTARHRILMFDLKGNLIGSFGERGKSEGEFNYPTSVALDKEKKIYVTDTLNFRLQVFDKGNNFLYSIGQAGDSSGSFSCPKGVSVDSFSHIYVTDGMFDNMQIFGQEKEFLLSIGEAGHKDGEFWLPCGIAIDSDNYIYIADSYNQRIQIFQYIGKD